MAEFPSAMEPAAAAALQDLRRGFEAVLDSLEAQLERAARGEREAEDLRGEARRASEAAERERRRLEEGLEAERARLRKEREAFEAERSRMCEASARRGEVLSLNIGGERVVQRRRSTLCAVEDSFLAARFSGRWEQELDRDEEGRYFINYSPDLFLPLLDFLGAKETGGPAAEVPLPRGPEGRTAEFQAMLKFFGMLPAVSALDMMHVPYEECTSADFGLAFEVVPKSCSLLLVGLETSAGKAVLAPSAVTVYVTQGPLLRRLRQRDEWRQVAFGTLAPGKRSRVELSEPVALQAKVPNCIYIATNRAGGVALGQEHRSGEPCAENDDLQVMAGRTSGSPTHFSGFEGFMYWFQFNGRLEYTVMDGL